MSWRIDAEVVLRIIESIKRNVEDEKTRIDIYSEMILALEDSGCDVVEDMLGEDTAFDEAFNAISPQAEDDMAINFYGDE